MYIYYLSGSYRHLNLQHRLSSSKYDLTKDMSYLIQQGEGYLK